MLDLRVTEFDKKHEVKIPLSMVTLEGHLVVPEKANSIVIFSHGSGSGFYSRRNNYVAGVLNRDGIATLLFDLLTVEEDEFIQNSFDINLLKDRLLQVTRHVQSHPDLGDFKIGYFGASTGAASALWAAAEAPDVISAVVSRGGRPDMAEGHLYKVKAPVLLIAGDRDDTVLGLNESAYTHFLGEKKIEIVKDATHFFEEPGKLEEVAQLASDWFKKYLVN